MAGDNLDALIRQINGCDCGHYRYPTEATAERAASEVAHETLISRGYAGQVIPTPRPCNRCGGWHLA